MHVVDAAVQQGIYVSRDALYQRLEQCCSRKDLTAGRTVHFFLVCKGLDTIAVLTNHLLRFYVACGSLYEAHQLFKVSKADLFSYNCIMSAHAKIGDINKTLQLFDQLQDDGLNPDKCTFLCVLSACGKIGALRKGRQIHSQITKESSDLSLTICNTIIDMYAKGASLDEAHRVFAGLSARDVVSWATLITGYAHHGHSHVVLVLFKSMQSYGLKPNVVIFSCVLKVIGKLGALHNGRQIHQQIVRAGFESDNVVATSLVDMYAKCKYVEDAQRVFDEKASSNVTIWNALIAGYAQLGSQPSALAVFEELLQKGIRPDKITYLAVLKACSLQQDIEQGKILHHTIVQSGLLSETNLRNSLINMYAKCCSMQDAKAIFKDTPDPDILSWGAMIDGYAEDEECGDSALQAFELMQKQGVMPNDIIFVSTLKACIKNGSLHYGRKLHDLIIKGALETGTFVGSAIVDMYAKYGRLDEASNCFDRLQDLDVVSWGAMVSGYIQLGFGDVGLGIFAEMLEEGIEPSEGLFIAVLQACANMDKLEPGNLIHDYIIKGSFATDGPVGTILVHMYAKFGSLKEARAVFDAHPKRDVVTWGAMLAGYVEHDQCIPAIELFGRMYGQNIKPNRVIFLCILKAFSMMNCILHARMVHKEITESGLNLDTSIGNTLVDMYTKCGAEEDAHEVLDRLPKRDVVSWSALLGGPSLCGDSSIFDGCFEAMKQEGLAPDNAVFTNILAACSHAGSLEKGLVYFKAMAKDHDILPGFQHYYSVADLLARTGLFKEAEDVLHSMPTSENIIGWTSLLSGCQTYGNVDVGNKSFDVIAELVPNDASSFMLLSSKCRNSKLW